MLTKSKMCTEEEKNKIKYRNISGDISQRHKTHTHHHYRLTEISDDDDDCGKGRGACEFRFISVCVCREEKRYIQTFWHSNLFACSWGKWTMVKRILKGEDDIFHPSTEKLLCVFAVVVVVAAAAWHAESVKANFHDEGKSFVASSELFRRITKMIFHAHSGEEEKCASLARLMMGKLEIENWFEVKLSF